MTSFNLNLALPTVPNTHDPELFDELLKIYNAIRTVAIAIDGVTGDDLIDIQLTTSATNGQLQALKDAVTDLTEQLTLFNNYINWEQPGELGANVPNAATVTTLNAKEAVTLETTLAVTGTSTLQNTTVAAFGANGANPSLPVSIPAAATDPATTMALANALRTLVINFGLGT